MSALLPSLHTLTNFFSVDLRDLAAIDQPYISGTVISTIGEAASGTIKESGTVVPFRLVRKAWQDYA